MTGGPEVPNAPPRNPDAEPAINAARNSRVCEIRTNVDHQIDGLNKKRLTSSIPPGGPDGVEGPED